VDAVGDGVKTRPLFSAAWHRVAGLRPRLRGHAQIHRQQLRGETWYVLEDRVGQRFLRFTPQAWELIGRMDGTRSAEELWNLACERMGDAAPTQAELIAVLAQLHAADVLQTERTPDAAEILERGERRRWLRLRSRLLGLFSWRIPLVDPERALERLLPLARPLVGWRGALVWLAVVLPAGLLLAVYWRDLAHGSFDQLLSAQNAVAFWVLFVVLKALHELGHAVVTKAYGGEVHDMGVLFLVFTPVPYVDASAAWKFPEKWRRIAVGAAGMAVELFAAALALYVWLAAEPGLVRTLAFDAVLIAGVSTVLFNANPLLRFDGYYMLSDWLEIPNLRARASRWVGYLALRHLLGGEVERPRTARGEPRWLVAYAVASFAYRAVVVAAILWFLGRLHLYLAVVFAALVAVAWIAAPVGRGVAFLLWSPRLERVRGRAIAVTATGVGAVLALLCLVPLPQRSRAEGVIWVPDEALVRAGVGGFVEAVVAEPGARVRAGETLFVLRDAALAARAAELEARVRELRARHDLHAATQRVKAQMFDDALRYAEHDLADARRRVAELRLTARRDGSFVVAAPEDLPGRFVEQGELVGYVVDPDVVTVRGVVPQSAIDLVRFDTEAVHVRLAERLADSIPGVVRRVVPGASGDLPTAALGSDGGGSLPVDPSDGRGVTSLERVFQVDVELARSPRWVNVGGRAYLRFDHGRAPLARQWARQLRQLFLSRLDA
jgi:putative peptide zinc metalloprotease protein